MRANRHPVNASAAPEAIGPYSHAVATAGLLFCSGQIPLDPATGELVDGGVSEQCGQCLRNLAAVCEAAGTELSRAARLTIYTTELDRFAEINEAYATFFAEGPPARAVIGVAALPKGAKVEIDAIVVL